MIFVTVGTHEQPFNRLVQEIDNLKRDGVITEDVIMQTGYSTYEPKYCQWDKLIPYKQMIKNVEDARIVITHGCCGRLAPHPPSVGASGTFPQGGRHSYQTWNNSAISCSFSWEPMTQSLPVTSGPQGRISCSPGTMSNSYQVSPPSTMPLARRIMP